MPRMPDANDPIAIAAARERRAAAPPPPPPPTPMEVARLEVAAEVAQLRANFARAAEETHRLRELNNNLVVRNSELHRQSERDMEQISALHGLVQALREKRRIGKHGDRDDEIPSESEEEESEESGEEIVISRAFGDGSVVVGAAAERPTRRLRPRLPSDADSEDEEEAVGYDVSTAPSLLQGSVEDTPPSQRPQVSAWMTTRVAPPTPAAPVKSGDTIEMVLVVAPKGISQIEID